MELLYGGGLRVEPNSWRSITARLGLEGGVARVLGKGKKERLCPLGVVVSAVPEKI